MVFYDFEVFAYDWLTVMIDMNTHEEKVIVNDPVALEEMYEKNAQDIWVGFNNKHYDQYIFKGILLSMDPKEINDHIIIRGKEGWQYSSAFNRIPMIQYDVMPNPPKGLKTLEGFLGSDIRETEVPFNINRKLTKEEIEQTIFYCRHDVEETIKVFMHDVDNFNAMHGIIQAFPDMVNLTNIGDSEARITAKVLGCIRNDYNDEFDYYFLPCLQIEKYKKVLDWFSEKQKEIRQRLELGSAEDEFYIKADFYKQSLTIDVAGVPHTFGFGGLHGAIDHPVHVEGALYHVDVNNYYPSMLLAWDIVTRSATNDNYDKVYKTRKALKYKQTHAKDKAEAKMYKKMQLPYKKMLNALSGAMKDATNPAYDPRNNNVMCINGQLMLLDLIEHLEVIPGFELIQSNTDGLIVNIPDTDEAFEMMDDICWEWECRCSTKFCDIRLELDSIYEIYQKDVNNYLWIAADGSVERIGAYVKELSVVDNDLPIVNKALVDYMVDKTPVEETINSCDNLHMFQKVVKLSEKYDHAEHEKGDHTLTRTVKHRDGTIDKYYKYSEKKTYTYKSYRVFASSDMEDGRLMKIKASGKAEKFADTPNHCFIENANVEHAAIPDRLDRQWYIDIARKRLKHFGLEVV